MNRHITAISITLLVLLGSAPAIAGPFGDEMAKCMVRETNENDKAMLVQWAFSVISLHPKVRQMAVVPEATRVKLNQGMADLMTSLLTERCEKESREAIKNEGLTVLESSFGLLGEVAMQGLFADPAVTQGVSEFSKHLDEQKLKAVIEAGK